MSYRARTIRPALLVSSLAFFAIGSVMAQDSAPEPVISVEGITEYQLDNGLRVLLFPDPSKEKVTVNVTYLVGSRHEGRGEKGMAHLLEHMVFKGTDTYENIWGALEDHGADFNGTTWLDRTNYYETLPASEENLRFALSMEADRMINSRIAAEDLASEFSVVRNEFEMGENNPDGVLFERILATAFIWHPYGNTTIGNRSDIERVPAENLKRFYEKYYQPDNALLVVAGHFDEEQALEMIEEYFGTIPRPERVLDATYTVEPVQDGARFVSLSRVASHQATAAAYHVCAGSHEDSAALQVFSEILTSEPSGRVYEALVPGGLATGVGAFVFPTAEPGLFLVRASSSLEQDVRAAHDKIVEVVESIAQGEITEEEVERAKTSLLKDIKLALANSGRIGIELSEWQALGDWRMFFLHRDRIEAIGVDDVRRVAERYFVESNRTSGIFAPVEEPLRAEIPPTPDVQQLVAGYVGGEAIAEGEAFEPTPENIESRTTRVAIDGGMKVALLPKETRGDQVVAQFVFHFGSGEAMRAHKTALGMIPELLMRGTERLDYQALQDEIDRIESEIGVSGGPGTIRASIVSDRANFDASIRLLGEILRTPTFPNDEFEIVKDQSVAQLESGLTDPQVLLQNHIQRLMSPVPATSFHYVPTLDEQLELTRAVTVEGLRELHGAFYGGSDAEAGIVGDFDADAVQKTLAEVFGDWKSPTQYVRVERPYTPIEGTSDVINTPDKKMALVARGTALELRDDDPDFAALNFANYVLGQSAKSRLLNRLRQEEGLSYGAGSMLESDNQDETTVMLGFAICAPENAGKAAESMREEFENWIEVGITEAELSEGKQGFTLKFDNDLANDSFVARKLVEGLEIDRTLEYDAALIRTVNGLSLEDVAKALDKHLGEKEFVDVKAGDLTEN